MLYFLGRIMFDRNVALVAALLLATSLSFWLQSEVAYPYTLLGCLSRDAETAEQGVWIGDLALEPEAEAGSQQQRRHQGDITVEHDPSQEVKHRDRRRGGGHDALLPGTDHV